MKSSPFSGLVRNPWALGSTDPRDFHPSSVVYDDGEYYVAELCRDRFLYFKRIGAEYCAFIQLAALVPHHISEVKRCHAGEPIDGPDAYRFIVERGAECIRAWERRI